MSWPPSLARIHNRTYWRAPLSCLEFTGRPLLPSRRQVVIASEPEAMQLKFIILPSTTLWVDGAPRAKATAGFCPASLSTVKIKKYKSNHYASNAQRGTIRGGRDSVNHYYRPDTPHTAGRDTLPTGPLLTLILHLLSWWQSPVKWRRYLIRFDWRKETLTTTVSWLVPTDPPGPVEERADRSNVPACPLREIKPWVRTFMGNFRWCFSHCIQQMPTSLDCTRI